MRKNNFSTLSSEEQLTAEEQRAVYLQNGYGTSLEKNRSLARFMSRQEMAKLLAYHEVFMSTKGLCGSIAECGVFLGGGLAIYANLMAALEPYNYQCKLIGFDTFEGNTEVSLKDKSSKVDFTDQKYIANNLDDLSTFIQLYDMDRPLSHLKKIELVKGDLVETSKLYLQENEETLFRIVHLSVNLYEPTFHTIKNFMPRLVSGGVLVIHAVNYCASPTIALLESMKELGFENINLKCINYYPNITYWTKP